MPGPLVSVVLPTRNRSTMMLQALSSALGQELVDLEVIVVDDGSSDDTAERLRQVEDERLTVLRQDTPRGVAPARNAAIERGTGEWLAFIDDDDLWAPDKLRKQLSLAVDHGHSLSYTGRIEIDENMTVLNVRHPTDPDGLATHLLGSNAIGTPSSVVIRADLLERVGPFDERLSHFEDWDLWIRAIQQGTASACDEPLVAYRWHALNAMNTDVGQIISQLEMLREKHRRLAAGFGFEVGAPTLAYWTAFQNLAAGRRLKASWSYLRYALMERSPRDLGIALCMLGGERFVRRVRAATARHPPAPDWLARYA
jgi:glycosyltransferase involved in cell wall biosynthesis